MSGALVQGCMNSRRFNKQRWYLWAGGGVVLLEDGLEERETRRLLYLAVLWMVGSPHEGAHQSHREMSRTDRSGETSEFLPGSGRMGTRRRTAQGRESPSNVLGI